MATGSPFSWLLCPFEMPANCVVLFCVFLSTLLLYETRCSRIAFYISSHRSRISHFSKGLWCLFLENGIRNLDFDAGYTHWLSLLLGFLKTQSKEIDVCISTCVCSHSDYYLYMYPSVLVLN